MTETHPAINIKEAFTSLALAVSLCFSFYSFGKGQIFENGRTFPQSHSRFSLAPVVYLLLHKEVVEWILLPVEPSNCG